MGNGRVLISPAWRGKLLANANDLSLTPDLLIDGVFDIGLTNFIISHVREMNAIDIGANIGYTTVLLGKSVGPGHKVYAYEASPKNYAFLEENIKMNYLGNIVSFRFAVSSVHGENLRFYEPERFMGNGSTKRNEITDSFQKNAPFDSLREILVPSVTIDKAHPNEKFGFIKMDIEGGEYQAFLGMEQTIKEGRVSLVSYELNAGILGDELFALKELMNHYQRVYQASFFTINAEGELLSDNVENLYSRNHVDNIVIQF